MKHLIIADTQCKPDEDFPHLEALGKYIVSKRPDKIIHIGDHFDMPSLSSYDRGLKSFEGRRFHEDIKAGHRGMELIVGPLRELQARQRRGKRKVYSPEMIFCMGNHEDRIDRFANEHPELHGFIGTKLLDLEQYGWKVYDFLKPTSRQGIFYVHYLANPMSGKPYGGNALNILKNVGRSFVVGHKQCLDIAIKPSIDGKLQIGIVNGAFYPHDEAYKGHQGNNHFRGITMLHDVKEGFGNPMMVSLDYLVKKYS
jgi:hypothetical protein